MSALLRRSGTVLATLTVAAGVVLVSPGPASASATKCFEKVCMHVSGSGHHVSFVQFSADVANGTTRKIFFDLYTQPLHRTDAATDKYSYRTRTYTWRGGSFYPYPGKRYYSDKYMKNRNFHQDYKVCAIFTSKFKSFAPVQCATIKQ